VDLVHRSMVDRAKGVCPDLIRAIHRRSGGQGGLQAREQRQARRKWRCVAEEGRRLDGASPEMAKMASRARF
jgi:hypothetical protein